MGGVGAGGLERPLSPLLFAIRGRTSEGKSPQGLLGSGSGAEASSGVGAGSATGEYDDNGDDDDDDNSNYGHGGDGARKKSRNVHRLRSAPIVRDPIRGTYI